MKIINRENDQEVVYVQKSDMMYVTHNCDSFPAALMEDFFSDIVIINGDNRNEFVRFTDPSEVDFFRKQEWIIDYRDFRNLSEAEIMDMGTSTIDELNAVAEEFNGTKNEKKKEELYKKHELLDYKFNSIREFLWFKQGHIQYSIPLVPDSEGFKFNGDGTYQMSASLEPNKILLYRVDGNALTKDEQIPRGFIETGISISLMDNSNNFVMGDYKTKNYISDDKKYLVIEFKFKDLKKTQEEETSVEVSTPKKESGIRRLVKRIFNRK